MNQSPRAKFEFKNKNVTTSYPTIGISHLVARTTKGPFNDPSKLISNIGQFEKIYGKEIVPDGTVSNIARALSLGSKLRISRVSGGENDPAYGYARQYTTETGIGNAESAEIVVNLQNPVDNTQTINLVFNLRTKEQGSSIVDPNMENQNQPFYLKVVKKAGVMSQWYLTQFKQFTKTSEVDTNTVLSSDLLFQATTAKDGTAPVMVDPQVFSDFVNYTDNIDLFLVRCESQIGTLPNTIKTTEDAVQLVKTYKDWFGTININSLVPDEEEGKPGTIVQIPLVDQFFMITEGDNGGKSTKETWLKAVDALVDHYDSYQIGLSHIHQHIYADYREVYKYLAEQNKKSFEAVVYVEIPKYKADGTVMSASEIATEAAAMQATVGYEKSIAYFAGGILLYNSGGILQKSDVLGTVMGLGDASASNSGPYYSFAGMNRGIVPDAVGPVTENLGAPSKYDALQVLADTKVNIFVIKDTPTAGKQTCLWHNYTSNFLDTSDKLLSSVRLSLYLKKNLRPILEKNLEEPNNWVTWMDMFYEAKSNVLDDLIGVSMERYEWLGDQYVTSFDELQINTEAEVRNGKYKAILKYKDIVTLQEVTMEIIVDASAQTVNISQQ